MQRHEYSLLIVDRAEGERMQFEIMSGCVEAIKSGEREILSACADVKGAENGGVHIMSEECRCTVR